MKKLFYVCALMCVFVLTACGDQDNNSPDETTTLITTTTVTTTVTTTEATTEPLTAYEQLSEMERKFVDKFVPYVYEKAVSPESVEIKAVSYYEDGTDDEWYVSISAVNSFGVRGIENILYIPGTGNKAGFGLETDQKIYSDPEYNVELITQAIQEQLYK